MTFSPRSKTFLLLQGPVGPLFRRLADALRAGGHRVVRVNLWGGDVLDFRGGVSFRGKAEAWPAWIRERAIKECATDLILFGDGRPAHAEAISCLRDVVERIHVLEEGYLRPHWITVDADGTGAASGLIPRTAFALSQAERHDGHPTIRPVTPLGGQLRAAAWRAIPHYLAGLTLRLMFRHYRPHRIASPVSEARAWCLRALRRRRRRSAGTDGMRAALAPGGPLYVLALQLEGDLAMRRHSNFKSNAEVIDAVIAEVARHAPDNVRLAIKAHPYEPDPDGTGKRIAASATAAGLSSRVHYIPDGPLGPLLGEARGLLCVNSTSAFQAIENGIPVRALGQALWDMAGVSHRDDPAIFWWAPQTPDPIIAQSLLTILRQRTQHNGAFYSKAGIALALPHLAGALGGPAARAAAMNQSSAMAQPIRTEASAHA